MRAGEIFSLRNPYFALSVGVAAAFFVLTALGGLIVLLGVILTRVALDRGTRLR